MKEYEDRLASQKEEFDQEQRKGLKERIYLEREIDIAPRR